MPYTQYTIGVPFAGEPPACIPQEEACPCVPCTSTVFVVAGDGYVTPIEMEWKHNGVTAVSMLTDVFGASFEAAMELFHAGATCSH